MIVEGILTTAGDDGTTNVAAMGIRIETRHVGLEGGLIGFLLRPFPGSRTFANLQGRPEGVFHLTDDVLLLARSALGAEERPQLTPAETVACMSLADCVRSHEFRVENADWSGSRAELDCRVTHTRRHRDWIGWNRAQHAVLELTISATRVSLIDRTVIEAQIESLEPLVDKTAGVVERAAWEFVIDRLNDAWSRTGREEAVR